MSLRISFNAFDFQIKKIKCKEENYQEKKKKKEKQIVYVYINIRKKEKQIKQTKRINENNMIILMFDKKDEWHRKSKLELLYR